MFGEELYWRGEARKLLDQYSLEEILELNDIDPEEFLASLLEDGLIELETDDDDDEEG